MSNENVKQLVEFEGECLYAQVYPKQARSPHPEAIVKNPLSANDKHFSIQVECSQDLYKKLRKAGISSMQELKDIDGKNYLKIKGTYTKTYVDKKSGETKTADFDPPTVEDADGNTFTDLIGNGSKVKVFAELAGLPNQTLKVLRLQKVVVLDHVSYEPPEETAQVVFSESKSGVSDKVTSAEPAKSFF